MTDLYEFNFLNDQLFALGSVNSIAELQGLLCGRLCAGEAMQAAKWQSIALEFMDLQHLSLSAEQESLFALLLERTRSLLDDEQFAFCLLLPGDMVSLEQRSRELAAWCEGFLHGLGQAIGQSGVTAESGLSDDVTGALRDMAHISQAVVDGEMELDQEENEAYWTELVEYVKVAVLNIYSEIAQPGNKAGHSAPNSDSLH